MEYESMNEFPSLPRTESGVCPIVAIVLSRRGTGKTRFIAALAPILAENPAEQEVIVSPIPTLHVRDLPQVRWVRISASDKEGTEELFRGFMEDGVERVVLADEGDELTAANAAGTAGGFTCQAVYDYVNYGREQGLGIVFSSRRPQNIAKDVCANANLVFVGNTTDPASLDYYRSWMADPIHPEIDYRLKCPQLPDRIFMGWSPVAGQKFLGYFTVDQNGDLRSWEPKELRDKPAAESASDTEPPVTIDTIRAGSGFPESDAGSASRSSRPERKRGIVTGI